MNAPFTPPAIRTTCPYCGVGCGILAQPDVAGGVSIAGDPDHPANSGRLCSKGSALGETLGLTGRLLHPMVRQDGTLTRTDWDTALDRVAEGFGSIIARHGPDAVAFYLSGQLLTEDYYVANKLMKGFIGSANVDTNSRLCMASSVAGHRRAFGSDTVPGTYDDLDEADLIVLVGSNAAWCHPVLFQRIVRNREQRGAKVVVIDPRRTSTGDEADLFLSIAPGMDTALFCGLLVQLADRGRLDRGYVERHTSGFAPALARAREIAPDIAAIAAATGLPAQGVARFVDLFCTTERVVTCFSQGVNQSAQGTDKVNAIINCHLATGRIGKPGQGPFSLTGQPNAMGGREVGGLANQLAAHMDFAPENVDRVGRFWRAPRMARSEGLKAVQMFDAIGRGEIKALWIMATNPAVSLPRAGAVREALGKLDLLVISDNVISNDTINAATHILLPAAAWGEKDGTVTNSERRVSRQRAFLPSPGEARPDWWMVSEVGRRMGFVEAFAYRSPADIFREHAALSGFENDGARDFDLGALARLGKAGYNMLEPVQWPVPADGAQRQRFFSDGRFYTPDGKARFVAVEPPQPDQPTSQAFPFRLNSGRVRDQWHSMTRSGMSLRLANHTPAPVVEVHPADAAEYGLSDGGFARISTEQGACTLKVAVREGQRPGMLFAPIHWSDATASSARIGDLVAPAVDPVSGQPELKSTPAAIVPVAFDCHGFIIVREAKVMPRETWWARVTVKAGAGFLLATSAPIEIWQDWVIATFPGAELAEYIDRPRGLYRAAAFVDGLLQGAIFIGPADSAPQWDAVLAQFDAGQLDDGGRRVLLSGRAGSDLPQRGPLVCSCFSVGLITLRDAVASHRAGSVEEIGRVLKAGTNCGSCIPELKRIIAHERQAATG